LVLEWLREKPAAQRTGADLVAVLARIERKMPLATPARCRQRELLGRLTWVEVICLLGACLADALQFAHERGLLHLDLKPGNILVTADAEPMVLDFHRARAPIRPDGPPPESVGGTFSYMPHEQQTALGAISGGRPITGAVDTRADVYSLGVVLYEALGGPHPYVPRGAPPLHRCNSQVSLGLSDVLHRCLAHAAAERYRSAGELA